MSQKQLEGGGLASLSCYTVDSDFSSDEEDINKEPGEGCKDFSDVYIKEEPEDVEELWSVDTKGARDPTETVQEFMELQEVKVEIESEDESESDSSSSSDSDEELENAVTSTKEDAAEKEEGPPRTKNELCTKDLPHIDDLTTTVEECDCLEVGVISSTVEDLVVIESNPGVPALDLETVLFLEKGAKALGKVFDVIGPVTRPFYVVRFNSGQHILDRGVAKGMMVYYAPKTEHTTFVFLEQLMNMKISDASWFNDEEPPPHFIEYSDDEEERSAKKERKVQKIIEKGGNVTEVAAKRGRYEEGRGRGRGRGGNQNGGQPAYCNSMYTAQTNPFYRSERAYDPRQGQISWGHYHTQGQYYQYPAQPGYSTQYNTQYTQYSNTPLPQYSSTPAMPHHALAGASWHSQYQSSNSASPYQQLSNNISKLTQQPPPPPPPPAVTSQPPPPPPSNTFGLVPPPPPPGTE